MSSINDALTYPTEHDEWIQTVLIGGILLLFGFLLLPLFLVYGYIIRVIQHRLDGDPEPPTFGEWEDLFIDGIKTFIIGLVYMLIPAAVGAFMVGGSIATMATGTRSGAAAGMAGLALGMLVTFALSLVFGYVAAAAIVNFANEERIGAAFDFTTLKTIALSRDYGIAWGLSIVVLVAANVVVGVLNVIPFLGFVIGVFVIFYAQIVAAHLWVDGYNDALDGGGAAGRSGADESGI